MPCALVAGGCQTLRKEHCAMEFVPARRLCANHGPNGLGLHDLRFKRITHHAANGFAAGGVTLQSESRRSSAASTPPAAAAHPAADSRVAALRSAAGAQVHHSAPLE